MLIDFEMNVRASRTTGAAHKRDSLPFLNNLANVDKEFFGVTITCDVTIAVIDVDG